jgi:hypothetical protein
MLGYPKPTDLSHLVDSRIGVPDYDPTFDVVKDLDLSNAVHWTIQGAASNPTANGFDFTGIGGYSAKSAYPYALVGGRTYIIEWDVSFTDQDALFGIWATDGLGNASPRENMISTVDGDTTGTAIYTCPYTEGGIYIRQGDVTATGTMTINSLTVKEWNGEELVPDEDVGFVANDVSKWSAYGTNTKAQDGNAVKITYVDNSSGANIYLRQTTNITTFSNLIPGQKYRLVFKTKVNTGSVIINVFSVGGNVQIKTVTGTEYETVVYDFEPTNDYLLINFVGMGAGEVIWFEALSLMKVTGLVAAYNMIPSGGQVLTDISGEGHNGTITDAVSDKGGMRFFADKGSVKLDQLIPISTVGTFAFRVKFKSIAANGNLVASYFTGGIRFTTAVITNGSFVASYYDGAFVKLIAAGAGTLTTDVWYNIVVAMNVDGGNRLWINGVDVGEVSTTDLSVSTHGYICSRIGTLDFADCEMDDVKMFNYMLSEQEAKDYHNKFAKQISQRHNFDDLGVGSTI